MSDVIKLVKFDLHCFIDEWSAGIMTPSPQLELNMAYNVQAVITRFDSCARMYRDETKTRAN